MKALGKILLAFCIVAFSFGSSQAAKLIDRTGQVLGEFIYEECPYVRTLQKIVCIDDFSSDTTELGFIEQRDIYFTSTDCTGTAYATGQWQTQYIYRDATLYYTGKASAPPTAQTLQSYSYDGTCHPVTSGACNPCWELKTVNPNFPFHLPVALPLRVMPGM